MKNGSIVKLVVPVVQGVITLTRWNNEVEGKEHLLQWVGANGENHERWFLESELEEVAAA